MKMQPKNKLNFKNPVIAAQAFESPFVPDFYLGHTMPPGKDFIGEKDYKSFDEVVSEIKKTKKKVILNIGDSSTSGWDSNIVTLNRERMDNGDSLLPAFFQYKTYSDYLRELVGEDYYVINAGVPAHTSLQGNRRLKVLMQRFTKVGIHIDWVTAYYGNNDSVWDHNRQDKEWVGKSRLSRFWKNLSQKEKKGSFSSVITRVSEKDYKFNMESIIKYCLFKKLKIIIIKPLTPIYWKPGTRVLNETLERINYPGSKIVYKLLDESLEIWKQASQEEEYTKLKEIAYQTAREKDYIVPRIKKNHLENLENVIKSFKIPFIDVALDRSEDDIRYFIDYCHPIGDANKFIALNIEKIILGKSSGVQFNDALGATKSSAKKKVATNIPTDHYTLY